MSPLFIVLVAIPVTLGMVPVLMGVHASHATGDPNHTLAGLVACVVVAAVALAAEILLLTLIDWTLLLVAFLRRKRPVPAA